MEVRSFHADEFWTIELACKPFLDGLKMVLKDVHGPVYYSYINLWEKVFGHGEVALFASNIPFLLIFMFVAFSWKNWFLVLSPALLHGFYELRGYGMLSAWVMLALWAVDRKPKLYILAVTLALYTEHLAWPWAFCLLFLNRKDTITAMCLGVPVLMLGFGQAVFSEQAFSWSRVAENYQPIWMIKKIVGFYFHSVFGYVISMVNPAKITALFR